MATIPETIRDLLAIYIETRMGEKSYGVFRLIIDGRKVTLALGADEGAIALCADLEFLRQHGVTTIDPRCPDSLTNPFPEGAPDA